MVPGAAHAGACAGLCDRLRLSASRQKSGPWYRRAPVRAPPAGLSRATLRHTRWTLHPRTFHPTSLPGTRDWFLLDSIQARHAPPVHQSNTSFFCVIRPPRGTDADPLPQVSRRRPGLGRVGDAEQLDTGNVALVPSFVPKGERRR